MDEIKDIVSDVIGKISIKQPSQQEKIFRLWKNILNEKELAHTRIEDVKNGTIIIIVDSPAWLYQMNLRRRSILDRLKEEDIGIKKISFKIGNIK